MVTIKARNANQMLPEAMHQIRSNFQVERRGSRNGPVRQFVVPVTLQYVKPQERVVFWPERDANPFFHLMESLWMLSGRNDVAFVAEYSSQIGEYSDDGTTFHGAYGYRWRRHFPFDQLKNIAETLKANPEDRRCVLAMWDAYVDGNGRVGKDFPCNIDAVFNRDHLGRLNMVVYNRSNDLVWGALGANCVHFSILQEFLCKWIGCQIGQYWQISANMHCYDFNSANVLSLADKAYPSNQAEYEDPYAANEVQVLPIFSRDLDEWVSDLSMFMSDPTAIGFRDPFFRRVAVPMRHAYTLFKQKNNPHRFDNAQALVATMADCDWKRACREWLERRQLKASQKAAVNKPQDAIENDTMAA